MNEEVIVSRDGTCRGVAAANVVFKCQGAGSVAIVHVVLEALKVLKVLMFKVGRWWAGGSDGAWAEANNDG